MYDDVTCGPCAAGMPVVPVAICNSVAIVGARIESFRPVCEIERERERERERDLDTGRETENTFYGEYIL